jgi:hypothetical protein
VSRTPCCPGCAARLDEQTRHASGWERSPYGDEFADELHRCEGCGAWWWVTFVDRFSGEDEIHVEGPLSEEEAREQRERIGEMGSES